MYPSGSILIVKKRGQGVNLIDHYGVYFRYFFGRENVVVEAAKGKGVTATPLNEFLVGRANTLSVKEPPTSQSIPEIKVRARSLAGRAYDVISKNCEQTANFIQRGKHVSSQIKTALSVGLGALAFFIVKKS